MPESLFTLHANSSRKLFVLHEQHFHFMSEPKVASLHGADRQRAPARSDGRALAVSSFGLQTVRALSGAPLLIYR